MKLVALTEENEKILKDNLYRVYEDYSEYYGKDGYFFKIEGKTARAFTTNSKVILESVVKIEDI